MRRLRFSSLPPAVRDVVLVTGATGRQGGAVVRHLQSGPFALRALTRDPGQAEAMLLRERGAEVVRGDLDDEESLRRACDGVSALFSVQDPWAHGVPREIEQGERLTAVAKAAGVKHIVYASVATAERKTGVPHFESKGRIERAIVESGMRWTFLRPVFFMDMLVPWRERRAALIWGALFRSAKPVQFVGVDDIGAIAAEALLDRDLFAGKAIELAGDTLTLDSARTAFREAIGRAPRRVVVPFSLMRLVNKEAAINFEWIRDEGWAVDIAACRERFPFMTTFPIWLRRSGPKEPSAPGRLSFD